MTRSTDDSEGRPTSAFANSVSMAMIAAGRQTQRLFEAELAAVGLSLRHLGALGHLIRDPDLSISELARRSEVTAQSMHATVRGLEERGAVVTEDGGRGRAAKVTVTAEGRALLDRAAEAATRVDATVVGLIGERDADRAQRILSAFSAGAPRR